MAERPKGISQETAEAYALLGIPYEGYVEGIGYQSLLAQTMGSCYFQERGCAIPQFEAVMDSSPEMRIQSVGYKHKVKAGDTLTSISQDYGITIASIMAANPGIDWPNDRNKGELLYVGETLALPSLGEQEALPMDASASTCMFPFSTSNGVRGMMEESRANSGGDALDLGNIANYFIGIGATFGETSGSTYRLMKGGLFRPKLYPSGWAGGSRGSIKTFSLAKTARGIGGFTIIVGGVLDGIGVFSYYMNGPDHGLSVHPGKAGLNLGVGVYSFFLNPIAGGLYFGIDLLYPGGWGGYMNDTDTVIRKNQEVLGPGWNMYRMEGGLK